MEMDDIFSRFSKPPKLEQMSAKETQEERERADRIFTSPHIRQAFRQLGMASIAENIRHYLGFKKSAILEMREKRQPDQGVLKNYPTVYLGSGRDIEYPLCLGARDIILVDPIFENEEAMAAIIGKIEDIIGIEPKKIAAKPGLLPGLSFTFDFGNGLEEAHVRFAGEAYYNEKRTPHIIPEKTGCILEFIVSFDAFFAGYLLDARAVRDKLVPGGMIISTSQALDGLTLASMHEQYREMLEHQTGSPALPDAAEYLRGVTQWMYRKFGYESIPLQPLLVDNKGTGKALIFLRKGYIL